MRARGGVAARCGVIDFGRLGDVLDADEGTSPGCRRLWPRGRASEAQGHEWQSLLLLRAGALEARSAGPKPRRLEKALALAPDQPLILNFLGYAKLERGEDMEAAEAMIRKASALAPDDASITDSLGWALFKRGRLDEAIATLQRAAKSDPARPKSTSILAMRCYTSGGATKRGSPGARRWSRPTTISAARLKAKLDSGLTPATAAP